MNRNTNILLGTLATAFGFYVIWRAWYIPVTVDESSTAITHVPRAVFDTLFFRSDANPNNHILNTLLIKAFTGIFGWHPFVFRLPALLGATMYAWAGFLLCRQISTQIWVRIFAYAVLLSQPFMLEFFSLARGYALGLGFMLVALWHAWLVLKQGRQQSLVFAILFAALAVYSNFTQLLFFVPFSGLLFLCAWQESSSVSAFFQKSWPALLNWIVFATLLFFPLSRLSHHSELVNWRELGAFFDSFQLSVHAAIHGNAYLGKDTDRVLTWLALAFVLGIFAAAIWRSSRIQGRFATDPRLFFVALFAGVLITNVLQVQITHTPYLQARLSLHYWPLFALSLATAAAWMWEKYQRWTWLYMAPVLLLTLINMVRNVDLRKTSEWWHDEFTYQIFEYLKNAQATEGRSSPYILDTHWLLQNSFMYHLELDPRDFRQSAKLTPWHDIRPPDPNAEFYYALNEEDKNQLSGTHEVVWQAPKNSMSLLRKKKDTGGQ